MTQQFTNCGDHCSSAREITLLKAETATMRRQLQILTVELSMVLELLGTNLGAPIVDTDSIYYKLIHGPDLESEFIKFSLTITPTTTTPAAAAPPADTLESDNFPGKVESEVLEEKAQGVQVDSIRLASSNNGSVAEEDDPLVSTSAQPQPNEPSNNIAFEKDVDEGPDSIEAAEIPEDADLESNTWLVNDVKAEITEIINLAPRVHLVRISDSPEFSSLFIKSPETEARPLKAKASMVPKGSRAKTKTNGNAKPRKNDSTAKALHSLKRKYCKRTFPTSNDKANHEDTPAGKRPYKRRFPKAAINTTGEETVHEPDELLDTLAKPYKCEFCDTKFNDAYKKIRHERTHTGERPFQCQYCTASFKQSPHLQRHERIHTGEKPYKCRFCNAAFKQSAHLRRHEKLAHNNQ